MFKPKDRCLIVCWICFFTINFIAGFSYFTEWLADIGHNICIPSTFFYLGVCAFLAFEETLVLGFVLILVIGKRR